MAFKEVLFSQIIGRLENMDQLSLSSIKHRIYEHEEGQYYLVPGSIDIACKEILIN